MPFQLPSLVVIDNFNQSVLINGSVMISLSCSFFKCSATRKGVIFQRLQMIQNGASPTSLNVVIDDSDSIIGTGYEWTIASLKSVDTIPQNSIPLGISVVYSTSSSVLGPPPAILSVKPSSVSFLGGSTITVTSSVWAILSRMQIITLNRTGVCRFALSPTNTAEVGQPISVAAANLVGGAFDARTCIAPQSPPFQVWNMSIILADSRRSVNFIQLETVCPNNYYVDDNNCSMCPSSEKGRSFNLLTNAPSISSCRCSPGSYGTFGFGCKLCPQLAGFNCSLADQTVPFIRPGFYGDYSLLSTCDETSKACAALMTCPFGVRACPGGGEKVCTRRDDECYDGRACSQCCSMYYLESGQCNKCPDPSTTASILAVMMVLVIVFAVLLSTSQSPSLSQSLKYFVMGMNFFQNVNSVKLINIEWPTEIQKFFDALAYFTFSVSSVRPECSFSWSFETRVVVTLLLPFVLSMMVLSIGLLFGSISCRRILKKIDNLGSKMSHIPQMSKSSIVSCWLHSVCFLSFQWKPDMPIWFALYPQLEGRWLGRELRTAPQNWQALQMHLKSKTLATRIFGVARRSNQIYPVYSHDAVQELHKIMCDEGLASAFASTVNNGRKFLSGIFSILVLCFVGTLTSALSAFNCEERDGMSFLVQEPTVECSMSSQLYLKLFSIAIAAVVLYAIAVPISVLFSLKSKWSQQMRSHDRKAFDALFGFLTSRYSSNCYLWELVTFMYKAFSVAVPVMYSSSPVKQSICMTVVSIMYTALVFNFSPFSNALMNFVEKMCLVSVIIMYFSALIFTCDVGGIPILDDSQKSILGVFLCVACVASSALCVVSSIYEYMFSLLFHSDLVISKWTQALKFAIGDCLNPFANVFLFFYVFYNLSARSSIIRRKRKWNEEVAQLLMLEGTEAYEQAPWWQRLKMRIVRWFNVISYGFKNKSILNCDSEEVKNAIQSPEAKLMQCFSKIEQSLSKKVPKTEHSISVDRGADKNVLKMIWHKIVFWKKKSTVSHSPAAFSVGTDGTAPSEFDPPEDFICNLSDKHKFISRSFSPTSISIWLTILLYHEKSDMGESQQAMAYLARMHEQLETLRQAVRSTHMVVQDILKTDIKTDQNESKISKFFQKIYLGSEGVCLLRFARMSYVDLADIMADKGLEAFSKQSMYVIPISQLVAAQRQVCILSQNSHAMRIRDMSPTLNQVPHKHHLQNDDNGTSLKRNIRKEASFRGIRRNAPAFGSKPSYNRRLAQSTAVVAAIPKGSQRVRPQVKSSKLLFPVVTASADRDSERLLETTTLPLMPEIESVESLILKLEALGRKNMEMEALVRACESEILDLKNRAENAESMLMQKDKEIAALKSTTAFLLKKGNTFVDLASAMASAGSAVPDSKSGNLTRETIVQSHDRSRIFFQKLQDMQLQSQLEIQHLRDAGANPDEIRSKIRTAEQDLLMALAADANGEKQVVGEISPNAE